MPSFILIHPTVWPQYTNVTDRQDRQRSDDIGRTVLQTVVQNPQVSVTGWAAGRWRWAWSTHATVSASQEQTLSGRGARVYTAQRAGWAWWRVSMRPRLGAFWLTLKGIKSKTKDEPRLWP